MKFRTSALLLTSFGLAVMLTGGPSRAAAEAGWIPLGPEAGQPVLSLVVIPGETPGVFAGASSGVFRSEDGTRWDLLNGDGLPLGISGTLHVGAVAGGPIYLDTDVRTTAGEQRIFKSADRGETWRVVKRAHGLLAVSGLDLLRLYLANQEGVEVSRDGGETWLPAASYPLAEEAAFFEVAAAAADPSSPDAVYVVLRVPGGSGVPDELRLVRSADGGASWEELPGPSLGREGVFARGLLVDALSPSILYLATTAGVFRSPDRGETWEARSNGLPAYETNGGQWTVIPLRALAVDLENPATLYAGLEARVREGITGGVYRSTDAGATWAPAIEGLPLPTTVQALAVDPDDSATLYAGAPQGVFQSTDGGDHWAPTPGSLPTPVASVAVDPRRPATLLAGTDDLRLFASDTGGQGWRRTGEGLVPELVEIGGPLYLLAIAPSDPSIVYGYGFFLAGIGRSTDGGSSWQVLEGTPSGLLHELVIDPRDPARVLTAFSNGALPGVLLSSDGGERWVRLLDLPVTALAQAPLDSDVLYAGSSIHDPAPGRTGGVCRSGDGGASWQCSTSGLTGHEVRALAVDPRAPAVLLAAVLHVGQQNGQPAVTTIHRSLDGGATWGPALALPEQTAVHELVFDPRNPKVVWAASLQAGVLRSTDGGASWSPSNRGLTHLEVRDLAFDPEGRVLLAATGNGVFRLSGAAGPAPPSEIGWIEDAALPGFRLKVRIAQGGGETIPGTKEPACIPETVCVSGALPGRSELFVRIVGPKPNGWLWPTLVKFSTSRIEVWIQQLSTGELRYYELRGASPGLDELPGLFDRFGFLPD
ncbi:MAG TPA: hypothetical protein VM599_02705 [Thermoanaerobaculia bacterium]|nr:hypothetical protein [Thermoanaerobaculia bacterium]